mmetsp:Transcript_29477/g.70054  ORF Transcript_29477/g.70054 Transcript_29477/m.70054 type:complete len:210 (+) Transcript_29477:151-780(+)
MSAVVSSSANETLLSPRSSTIGSDAAVMSSEMRFSLNDTCFPAPPSPCGPASSSWSLHSIMNPPPSPGPTPRPIAGSDCASKKTGASCARPPGGGSFPMPAWRPVGSRRMPVGCCVSTEHLSPSISDPSVLTVALRSRSSTCDGNSSTDSWNSSKISLLVSYSMASGASPVPSSAGVSLDSSDSAWFADTPPLFFFFLPISAPKISGDL